MAVSVELCSLSCGRYRGGLVKQLPYKREMLNFINVVVNFCNDNPCNFRWGK